MNNIVSKIVDELLVNGYFVTDFRRAIKRNIEQIASSMQRDYRKGKIKKINVDVNSLTFAEMGFYKNDDDSSYMVAYGRVSELITHYLPPILSDLDVENDKWFIRDLYGNATDVLVKTKLVRKLRDTVNDKFKRKVFQLKNTGYFIDADGNSYKSMV